MIEVRRARDAAEVAQALGLRRAVFVAEQGVTEAEELDGRDEQATHLVAIEDGQVLATCRLLAGAHGRLRLGRLAVRADRRRQGIATLLLDEAEATARATGARTLVLHAQTYACALYEAAGYRRRGEPFTEAGVEHVTMERPLA